jgi:hypothetical protein
VLPEIWALGLRHPQNLCFDRGGPAFLIADIGQAQLEEVNLGAAGANYGWPLREGTFATVRDDESALEPLPADDGWSFPGEATKRPFTYPVAQYDRSEGFDAQGKPIAQAKLAITGGLVYRGAGLTQLRGHYICGDLVNGRIFHVPVSELVPGTQATLRELTLKRNGVVTTLRSLVGTTGRVDLRFGEGADGAIYVLTKQDGKIRKLLPPRAGTDRGATGEGRLVERRGEGCERRPTLVPLSRMGRDRPAAGSAASDLVPVVASATVSGRARGRGTRGSSGTRPQAGGWSSALVP